MSQNSVNQAAKIIIHNLNPQIQQDEIMTLFEPFGKIISCSIKKNDENSTNYAIIQYENESIANNAVSKMDGQTIKGYTISIKTNVNKNEDSFHDTNNDTDDVDDDDEFDDDGDSDDSDDDDSDDDD